MWYVAVILAIGDLVYNREKSPFDICALHC